VTISDLWVFSGTVSVTADSDADAPPAIDLVGGTGSYTFSASACQYVFGATATSPCSITASGSYANTVCGTGSVSGSARVSSLLNAGTATFFITFTAGVGTLTGTVTLSSVSGTRTEAIDGTVVLAPRPAAGNDLGDCVNGFTVAGRVDG
jgi:hypothetical protein